MRNNLSSDDNRFRVWRPRRERLNPVFTLQRYTAPTAGVMVGGTIAENTRSPIALMHGTVTAQRWFVWFLHVLVSIQIFTIIADPTDSEVCSSTNQFKFNVEVYAENIMSDGMRRYRQFMDGHTNVHDEVMSGQSFVVKDGLGRKVNENSS
ncbi:uncharacterized protein TNCV_1573911 [Trichonephila clavipes]|nr:uncharacterized protein TNCV_1573911 [Trichonephila clavipes]